MRTISFFYIRNTKMSNMRKIYSSVLFIVLFSFLFSCRKNSDVSAGGDFPGGTITGKVVANNNVTPIRHALVYVSKEGKIYHSYTDMNGNFSFKVPVGHQKIYIQTGDGSLFRTIIEADVVLDQTIVVSSTSVKLLQVANLAYEPGVYDQIEDILIDSMGYTATELSSSDLENINNIIQYDAIFFNCGGGISDSLSDKTLSDYVTNGGSIYASDWAVSRLTGEVIMGGTRPGGFINDNLLATSKSGASHTTVYGAYISSVPLQVYLNKTSTDILYDLGSWEHINSLDTNFWEVLVKNPAHDSALAIRTHSYAGGNILPGRVGSAADTNWITICHVPADDPSHPITITIPSSEVDIHLAHGDHVGSCDQPNGAGWIYYTTFHNHANGLISPDIRGILEFMILNL